MPDNVDPREDESAKQPPPRFELPPKLSDRDLLMIAFGVTLAKEEDFDLGLLIDFHNKSVVEIAFKSHAERNKDVEA